MTNEIKINGKSFNMISILLSFISLLVVIIGFMLGRFVVKYDEDVKTLRMLEKEMTTLDQDHKDWRRLKSHYDTTNIMLINMSKALRELKMDFDGFQKQTNDHFIINEQEMLELWKQVSRNDMSYSILDCYKDPEVNE